MLSNIYVWDISEYDAVMPWIIETSRPVDPNMEIVALALYPDNTEHAPFSQWIQLVVHILTFNASAEGARTALDLFSTTVPRRNATLIAQEYKIASLADEYLQQHKANLEGINRKTKLVRQ
jgi:hypothetical protein